MAKSEQPGPKRLPVVGHTYQYARDVQGFYEDAASYGDVVKLDFLGMDDVYLLADPKVAKEVLALRRDSFRRPERIWSLLGDLLREGLVPANGDSWRKSRDIVEPAFTPEKSRGYVSVVVDNVERHAERWVDGQRYDVHEEMKDLMLRIIVEILFGTDVDYEGWGFRKNIQWVEEPVNNLLTSILVPKWVPIPMWRQYKSAIGHFDEVLPELIEAERNAEGERNNVLSEFIERADTDGEIRDELMTLIFAGHETSSRTLPFALYLLDDNPEAAERFYREIDEVLDGRTPTVDDLRDLEYTRAVVSETMRLYPTVPRFALEAEEEMEIGGHRIPEGGIVEACPWVLHRDERFWDDPEEFRPERWLEGSDRPQFAYFPFGGGKRRCIGSYFAQMEMQLVLAALGNSWRIRFDADELSVRFSFVLLPQNSFEAVVERR